MVSNSAKYYLYGVSLVFLWFMCNFPKGPCWFSMAMGEVSGTFGAINRFVPVMNPVPYFSHSFTIHAPACITGMELVHIRACFQGYCTITFWVSK